MNYIDSSSIDGDIFIETTDVNVDKDGDSADDDGGERYLLVSQIILSHFYFTG